MSDKILISTIKILFIFSLISMLVTNSFSQESILNGTSSAGVVGAPVKFNCDYNDVLGMPGVEVMMHYGNQADTVFNDIPMTLMDEDPYYSFTYETDILFQNTLDILCYYFSAREESLLVTQSPFNADDIFPPPTYSYADMIEDPEGDTLPGTGGGWLDITRSGITYSDSRIYAYMSNATGEWPTSQGYDTYFFYCFGFIDTSSTNVWFFSMVYVDIPFIASPGLYKLSLIDTSFYRIGDIDYDISDSNLHMSCSIDDLVSDPDWNGWPQADYMVSERVTFTASSFNIYINDFTFPTFFEPETQFLDFNDNTSPDIFDYTVTGDEDTGLEAIINYCDPDNDLPLVRQLNFDQEFYNMGSFDHFYSDTSEFEYILSWPGYGWHYFYFQFSDGLDTLQTMLDSVYFAPTGVDDGIPLSDEFILHQNYPNPFNGCTSISFEIKQAGKVDLSVYDIAGKFVVKLINEYLKPGFHSIIWDGYTNSKQSLSSGVYFYKLKVGCKSVTRKMFYIK